MVGQPLFDFWSVVEAAKSDAVHQSIWHWAQRCWTPYEIFADSVRYSRYSLEISLLP